MYSIVYNYLLGCVFVCFKLISEQFYYHLAAMKCVCKVREVVVLRKVNQLSVDFSFQKKKNKFTSQKGVRAAQNTESSFYREIPSNSFRSRDLFTHAQFVETFSVSLLLQWG